MLFGKTITKELMAQHGTANAGYNIADNETEKTNAQLTLQWQPSDDVRATLDYTHSTYDFFGTERFRYLV